MVDFILWSDAYSVGIPDIDTQHMRIVTILNELFEAKQKNGLQSLELKRKLLLVKIYTETHFQYEETLMRYAHFPEYEEHCKYHLEMKNKTKKIIKEVYVNNSGHPEDLFQFLKMWWVSHIQGKDKHYTPYMHKLGL
jgi:hemerythrin-like metal-binding protein